MMKFDAHVHLNTPNGSYMDYMVENDICLLSIITEIPGFPSIEEQLSAILALRQRYPDHIDFATTFSCKGWRGSNWTSESLDFIKRSMDAGAVGLKVWKNIGMSLKDGKGTYKMADDPTFEPIFEYLEDNDIVLLGHNGEPRNCWLPIEEMTVESDRSYYTLHPEYHMHQHPEVPDYNLQLKARDNVLMRHPNLRFVGLHLASYEWSIDKVAAFLDQFPNAMVDLAERICHLQFQAIDNWQAVYNFFIQYQDRIIYGTDLVIDGSQEKDTLIPYINSKYEAHHKFFSKQEWMSVPKVRGDFKGLGLPASVLKKIYTSNAMATYCPSRQGKMRRTAP